MGTAAGAGAGAAAAEVGVYDEEVMEWLVALGIDKPAARKYAVGLKDLGVDAPEDMYALEAEDLQEIAMKMLHRKKVLKKIAGGGES